MDYYFVDGFHTPQTCIRQLLSMATAAEAAL